MPTLTPATSTTGTLIAASVPGTPLYPSTTLYPSTGLFPSSTTTPTLTAATSTTGTLTPAQESVSSPYSKTTWVDNSAPPIDAANLNNIESGIADAPYGPDASTNNVPVWNGSAWVYQGIKNAQVDAAAAIAYSKLNLATSIVNADISASAAIAYTKLALTGTILDADISASATNLHKLSAATGSPSSSTFLRGDGSWASTSITTASNSITADVTMTSASTFYDGPSVSLAAGTWFIHATCTFSDASAASITLKLWDGSTVSASTEDRLQSANPLSIALAAIVTPGSTTTYKASAAANTTGAKMIATVPDNATGATSTASTLVALKLA